MSGSEKTFAELVATLRSEAGLSPLRSPPAQTSRQIESGSEAGREQRLSGADSSGTRDRDADVLASLYAYSPARPPVAPQVVAERLSPQPLPQSPASGSTSPSDEFVHGLVERAAVRPARESLGELEQRIRTSSVLGPSVPSPVLGMRSMFGAPSPMTEATPLGAPLPDGAATAGSRSLYERLPSPVTSPVTRTRSTYSTPSKAAEATPPAEPLPDGEADPGRTTSFYDGWQYYQLYGRLPSTASRTRSRYRPPSPTAQAPPPPVTPLVEPEVAIGVSHPVEPEAAATVWRPAERLPSQRPSMLGYASTVETMSVTRVCALIDAAVMEAAHAAGLVDDGRVVAALREVRMDPRAAARAVEQDLRRRLRSVARSESNGGQQPTKEYWYKAALSDKQTQSQSSPAPSHPLSEKQTQSQSSPAPGRATADVGSTQSPSGDVPGSSSMGGGVDPLAGGYWHARSESASRGADDALLTVTHHLQLKQLDAEYQMRRRQLLQHQEEDERLREQLRRSFSVEAQERRGIEQQIAAFHADAWASELQVQNDLRVDSALKMLMESVAVCQRELNLVDMFESEGAPSLRTSSYFCTGDDDQAATPLVRLRGELSELSRSISTTLEASAQHRMGLSATSSGMTQTPMRRRHETPQPGAPALLLDLQKTQSSQPNGSLAAVPTVPPPSPTSVPNPDSQATTAAGTSSIYSDQRRRAVSPGRRAETKQGAATGDRLVASKLLPSSPAKVLPLSPSPRTTSSRPTLTSAAARNTGYSLADGDNISPRDRRARSPVHRPGRRAHGTNPEKLTDNFSTGREKMAGNAPSPAAASPSAPAPGGTAPSSRAPVTSTTSTPPSATSYELTSYELLERQKQLLEERQKKQEQTQTARMDSAPAEPPQPARVTSAQVADQAKRAVSAAAAEQPLWPLPRTLEDTVATAVEEATAALATAVEEAAAGKQHQLKNTGHPKRQDHLAATAAKHGAYHSKPKPQRQLQPQSHTEPEPEPASQPEPEPEPQSHLSSSGKLKWGVDGRGQYGARATTRVATGGTSASNTDAVAATQQGHAGPAQPTAQTGVTKQELAALPAAAQPFDVDGNGVLDGVEVAAMLKAMGNPVGDNKQRHRASAKDTEDAASGSAVVSPDVSSADPAPARAAGTSREPPRPAQVTSTQVADQARRAISAAEQPLWPYPRTLEETVASAVEEATAALAEKRASMTNKVTAAVAASTTAAAQNRDRDREAARQRRDSQKVHDPTRGYRSRG